MWWDFWPVIYLKFQKKKENIVLRYNIFVWSVFVYSFQFLTGGGGFFQLTLWFGSSQIFGFIFKCIDKVSLNYVLLKLFTICCLWLTCLKSEKTFEMDLTSCGTDKECLYYFILLITFCPVLSTRCRIYLVLGYLGKPPF